MYLREDGQLQSMRLCYPGGGVFSPEKLKVWGQNDVDPLLKDLESDRPVDLTTRAGDGPRTWRDDRGERARRYYAWCRVHLKQRRFTSWNKALTLVVVTQTSSASVERIFSVLKMIVDVCGIHMTGDTRRYRLFVQANQHVADLLALLR